MPSPASWCPQRRVSEYADALRCPALHPRPETWQCGWWGNPPRGFESLSLRFFPLLYKALRLTLDWRWIAFVVLESRRRPNDPNQAGRHTPGQYRPRVSLGSRQDPRIRSQSPTGALQGVRRARRYRWALCACPRDVIDDGPRPGSPGPDDRMRQGLGMRGACRTLGAVHPRHPRDAARGGSLFQPGGAAPAWTANTMTSVNPVPRTCSAKHPGPSVLNRPSHALQNEDEGAACSCSPPPVASTAETNVTECCLSLAASAAKADGGRVSP